MNEFSLQVLSIGLHDRPGAVHGVAEVFSGRGLQMEAFYGAANSLTADGQAQALILFNASDERAELVMRVLRRLSSVSRATLLKMDDPRLVQSVLVAHDGRPAPEGIGLLALEPGVALAAGSPQSIQAWLASSDAPRRLGAVRLDLIGDLVASERTALGGDA